MPLFGAHMSTAGGLYNALVKAQALDCDTVQLFVSQPRVWPVTPVPEAEGVSRFGKFLTKNASQWKGRELGDDEVATFRRMLRASKLRYPTAHDSYLINLASPDET